MKVDIKPMKLIDICHSEKCPEWKLIQMAIWSVKDPEKLTYESLSYFTGLNVRKIWNLLHE